MNGTKITVVQDAGTTMSIEATRGLDEPQTPQQWQEAADAAHALLRIQSAVEYGLVNCTLKIDQTRCRQLLLDAVHKHGIQPRPDAVERFLSEMAQRVSEATSSDEC